MKYIGQYLRINSLSLDNIVNQLQYFSRESLKNLVLYSKCGITMPYKEIKAKSSSTFDSNIFKEFSPLLCVYKKSNPKFAKGKSLFWNEETFKKDINITGNVYMTLCLLKEEQYYYKFKDIDEKMYSIGTLYSLMSKLQLDFYMTYLRNDDGMFIDKKFLGINDNKFVFLTDDNVYKVFDQCLMMLCSYIYYRNHIDDEDSQKYKAFSQDALDMFINYKDELYGLSSEELLNFLIPLNLFYGESENIRARNLLLDLMDFAMENAVIDDENPDIKKASLLLLNINIFNKNMKCDFFQNERDSLKELLISSYMENAGTFTKNTEKKEVSYSPDDLMTYMCAMKSCKDENLSPMIIDIYKKSIISSGIISSWPSAPSLSRKERYYDFSLKSDDLIGEENFKQNSIPTPDSCGNAPVFYKAVKYSNKKLQFSSIKDSFNSEKSICPLFLALYVL